jgi:NADH dehydrogenase [ubiquinone] 1 alpha subcomplex assembly factor 7
VSLDPASLAERLAKQISVSGPISVAEYMRQANAAYYNKDDPFGVAGDFITAPEISQIFGELVGLWFADLWLRTARSDSIQLVELGPGRGTLMADMLRAVGQFDFAPTVHFVETSESLRAAQTGNVPHAHHHDSIDSLPGQGPLFLVANEFFDALPVRQFISTHAGWRERVLVRERGQTFSAMPGTMAADHLVPADIRNAPRESIYETSPNAAELLFALLARLRAQGGVLLIIDYGYAEPGLGSTLQAVKAHSFADPFDHPGEHDLTAHVNFAELRGIAKMQDMAVYGPVGQGDWLTALGIDLRAQTLAASAPGRATEIIAMRDRLVDPAQMGTLFKVMAITSTAMPAPEGFAAGV